MSQTSPQSPQSPQSPILAVKAMWQLHVRKRPFVLSHGINARCNMQCKFCDYWKQDVSDGSEMSTQEIFDLLDEAYAFGIRIYNACLLYTSDAADEEDSVDLGGRRIIKK